MDKELKARISAVTDEAEYAFWEVVATRFPEATDGDLDPLFSSLFSVSCEDVVEEWVATNTDLIPEED